MSKPTLSSRKPVKPRTKRAGSIDAAPDGWENLSKFAQELEQAVPDTTNLSAGLALLGSLLKSRGLAIVTPSSQPQILAHWGRLPHFKTTPKFKSEWHSFPLVVNKIEYGSLWISQGDWVKDPVLDGFRRVAVQLFATAVHAQTILRQERDKRALAETLQHVSEVLTSTLDLDQVLARILDELARLVPYDSALVMLLQEGRLYLHAQRGYKRLSGHGTLEQVTFIPEKTARVMDVLSGTEPLILGDIRQVPDWVRVPFSAHIRSWMGVPLRVHDRATGLFSIDKAEANYFTPRHAALAAALAPHAAIAIENARLFQELKSVQAQLRQLSAHVINVQEAERQRIGRELHDDAGQAIVAMRAEMQILARQLPKDADAARAQLSKVDSILRTTARDLRLLSHELRSHLLDELGLASALQQHLRDFQERFGLHTEFAMHGQARRYPRIVELTAFRIAQEALTNVARHAQAKTVFAELTHDAGCLRLLIRDDGAGFEIETQRNGTMGLIGMRERAMAANGTFQITTSPGHGTRVVAEFPLEPGAGQ